MNAKELILSKINATSKFVDIYTYGLTLGNDFNKIADIMKSPIFNEIVKLTETNLFNPSTSKYSLKSALEFYVNNKLLPGIDSIAVIKALEQNDKNIISKKDGWEQDLWDDYKVQAAIDFIVNKYLKTKILDSDYYDSQQSLLTEEEIGEDVFYYQNNIERRNFVDNPITQKEALDLINYFQEVLLRNKILANTSKEQIENLSMILNSILPAMEEMELLGAMLGVNQGLRTNDYDMYSFIKRIENFVNNRITAQYLRHKAEIQRENKKLPITQQKKLPERPELFNLMRFLNDSVYQENMIRDYDSVKSTHNILDIITKVPHFTQMFKTLSLNTTALSRYSIVYKTERNIADQVINHIKKESKSEFDFKLAQPEFREIEKTIYDTIISQYIIQAGFKINLPKNFEYFNGITNQTNITTKIKEMPINSLASIANFKKLMDEVLIPQMIQKYPEEAFTKALIRQTKLENDRLKTNWRPILQMMNINDTAQTQLMYSDILNSFDKLANQTINNWKIADLFYLYNLITYKDSFGQDSFTRVFENLINSKNTTFLVNDFYQYLSDLDHGIKTLDINFDNILSRLSVINKKIKKRKGLNRVSPITYDASYFTFDLPFSNDISVELVDPSKPIGSTQLLSSNDLNSYFNIYVDNRTAISNFVNQLKQVNPNIQVQLVSQAWLDSHVWVNAEAEAFIEEGTIYINMDKASKSSLIHELGHLFFAYLKSKNTTSYYQAISAIRQSKYFDQIAKLYPDSHGSDLLEEVMLKLMQMRLDNLMLENEIGLWDNIMHTLYPEGDTIDVLTKLAKDIITSSLEDARYFDPSLIQKSQKSATWKDELVKTKQLTEDCSK